MKTILLLLCILPLSASALPFKWWLPFAETPLPNDPNYPPDYWPARCEEVDCTPRYPIPDPRAVPHRNALGEVLFSFLGANGKQYGGVEHEDGRRTVLQVPDEFGTRGNTINDRGWIGGDVFAYVGDPRAGGYVGGVGPGVWTPAGKYIEIEPKFYYNDTGVYFISDDGWACVWGSQAWNVYTHGVGDCRGDPRPLSEPGALWLIAAALVPLVLRRTRKPSCNRGRGRNRRHLGREPR